MPPTKPNLRTTLKAALTAITLQNRTFASQQLCDQLTTSDLYQSATTILTYAALPTELSLDPLINHALQNNKTVCLPAIDWNKKTIHPVQIQSLQKDLHTGPYALRSPNAHCPPIPDAQITLALIPGLAFDSACQRLGRGAGFYDRWIEKRRALKEPITILGVSFDEQLIEQIPTDPHDQHMNQVVTPTTQYTRTLT